MSSVHRLLPYSLRIASDKSSSSSEKSHSNNIQEAVEAIQTDSKSSELNMESASNTETSDIVSLKLSEARLFLQRSLRAQFSSSTLLSAQNTEQTGENLESSHVSTDLIDIDRSNQRVSLHSDSLDFSKFSESLLPEFENETNILKRSDNLNVEDQHTSMQGIPTRFICSEDHLNLMNEEDLLEGDDTGEESDEASSDSDFIPEVEPLTLHEPSSEAWSHSPFVAMNASSVIASSHPSPQALFSPESVLRHQNAESFHDSFREVIEGNILVRSDRGLENGVTSEELLSDTLSMPNSASVLKSPPKPSSLPDDLDWEDLPVSRTGPDSLVCCSYSFS